MINKHELQWATVLALETPWVDMKDVISISQPTVIDTKRYQPLVKNPIAPTSSLVVDFSGNYEICVTAICFGTVPHTQRLFGLRTSVRDQGPFMDICWNDAAYPYSYYFRHTTKENENINIEVKKDELPAIVGEWMIHKLIYRRGKLSASITFSNGIPYFSAVMSNVSPGCDMCEPLIGGGLPATGPDDYVADNCAIDFSNTYIQTENKVVWGRKTRW